jgi:hypothetical protein
MLRAALLCLSLLLAPAGAQAQAPYGRSLADVTLAGRTTQEDVRRIWGRPDERRGQWVRYRLSSGSELHLMYSPLPPHRLVYADLYGRGRRAGDRLFGTDERIAARDVSQIDPCRTEEGAVVPIWGWPNYTGDGDNRFYALANGDWARLGPPDSMRGITVVNGFDHRVIREISPGDCPRRALVPAPPPSSDRDSVDPFIPPRLLTDIPLVETLKAEDVEALWGTPRPFGTDWRSYELASGETLSFLFGPLPPHHLVYADLHAAGDRSGARRLFANNVRARSRSIDQILPCGPLRPAQRFRWGPPDWSFGSGVVDEVYTMANGAEVTLVRGASGRGSHIRHPDGRIEPIDCPADAPK